MIQAQLEDGRVLEFPDGTDPQVIQATVKRTLGVQDQAMPAQPQPTQAAQTRRGLREERDTQSIDPFAGLPEEVVSGIESRIPMPEGDQVRGPAKVEAQNKRKQAAQLEKIRLINPGLAELIEEQGNIDAFLIGAGRGLTAIPRAFGAMEESDIAKQAIEGLRGQRPAATMAGEIVGESAPFAAVGGPLAGLGKTAAQRTALLGGLGATEGGTITAAEGGEAKDIAAGAALGGATAFLPGVGGSGSSRISSEARRASLNQGREMLKVSNKDVRKAVSEAAPSVEQLKTASKDIYNAIESDGARVSLNSFETLENDILRDAVGLGMRPRLADSTLGDVKNIIDDVKKGEIGIKDLEDIRKAAMDASSTASRAGQNQLAAIQSSVVDNIDDFLSSIKPADFSTASDNAAAELAAARKLWGRARKQELLDDVVAVGKERASGSDTGIRNEIRNLVNNKKRSKYFSEDELNVLRDVSKGTVTSNTFRKLGRMGFGQAQQTNVLGGAVSSGTGAYVLESMFPGGGAVIGAILFPTVGKLSADFAEKLTKNSAKLAGQYVRAGSDAEKIARIYLSSTPKELRNPEDLAKLLMRPDISLKDVNVNDFVAEVIPIAQRMREAAPQAATAATATAAATSAAASEDQE